MIIIMITKINEAVNKDTIRR